VATLPAVPAAVARLSGTDVLAGIVHQPDREAEQEHRPTRRQERMPKAIAVMPRAITAGAIVGDGR
jgi:hypothetical protein